MPALCGCLGPDGCVGALGRGDEALPVSSPLSPEQSQTVGRRCSAAEPVPVLRGPPGIVRPLSLTQRMGPLLSVASDGGLGGHTPSEGSSLTGFFASHGMRP